MAKKGRTILIVDDEENIRCLVRSMLDKENTVIEAENGEAAVDMVMRHKPDLILMDILMPKMDGYTTCNTLKTTLETRMIPIVMFSAVWHEFNMEISSLAGANGYMTKPFSQQNLLDTVNRFLKKS